MADRLFNRERRWRSRETAPEYRVDFRAPDFWAYQRDWLTPGPFTGIGPRSYHRSDERIREEVCDRLCQHGQIDASEIEVEVQRGEVTLKGSVDSRWTKRMAEDTIENIPGVTDIHNKLRLSTGREQ